MIRPGQQLPREDIAMITSHLQEAQSFFLDNGYLPPNGPTVLASPSDHESLKTFVSGERRAFDAQYASHSEIPLVVER